MKKNLLLILACSVCIGLNASVASTPFDNDVGATKVENVYTNEASSFEFEQPIVIQEHASMLKPVSLSFDYVNFENSELAFVFDEHNRVAESSNSNSLKSSNDKFVKENLHLLNFNIRQCSRGLLRAQSESLYI